MISRNFKENCSKLLYSVCISNPHAEFKEIGPIGKGMGLAESSTCEAYREGDFGAALGYAQYSSTIRSIRCCLLVQGIRCINYSKYHEIIWERKQNQGGGRSTILLTGIFSAPEPKAQVHYCDHTLSVVSLSPVVRPSSLTFHVFDFSSETAE